MSKTPAARAAIATLASMGWSVQTHRNKLTGMWSLVATSAAHGVDSATKGESLESLLAAAVESARQDY